MQHIVACPILLMPCPGLADFTHRASALARSTTETWTTLSHVEWTISCGCADNPPDFFDITANCVGRSIV